MNQNQIQHAVALSAWDGDYSAYYPSDTNWDGKLPSVQVKAHPPGLRLRYRRGYQR
jgi:hypothetical protein